MFREILVVNTVEPDISRNLSVMHIHALTIDVDVDAYYNLSKFVDVFEINKIRAPRTIIKWFLKWFFPHVSS